MKIACKAANGPLCMQLLKEKKKKKKKKTKKESNNQGMENGGRKHSVWTLTSSMNECMGVLLKKMSLPMHQLNQEIENI